MQTTDLVGDRQDDGGKSTSQLTAASGGRVYTVKTYAGGLVAAGALLSTALTASGLRAINTTGTRNCA